MTTFKREYTLKNNMFHLVMILSLFLLAACGGGGGGTPAVVTTYTVTFVSGGNGTLSGAASQTITAGASSTAVTAIPATGYHFVNWSEAGSVAGVNPSLVITNVTADHSYTANFALDPTATVTINLTGTLPANTGISGAAFVLSLPTGVTPSATNGVVSTGVVTNSGTFAGSTLSPQTVYTPTTAGSPGTLRVILADSAPAGVVLVGEVVTITLQLAAGVTPVAADFGISSVSVIDAVLYNQISGMGASIAGVTVQ